MTKSRQVEGKAVGVAGRKAHHTIESLDISGGFLKGARFEFVDGLNCIIGGRGTGKTTVLEFVRHVLGMGPDEKTSPARAKSFRGQVQTNLNDGQVRLGVRTRHGVRYTASRPWNDDAQTLNDQNEPTPIALDRDLIFQADVYSVNQIEEIAVSPGSQLALIDTFKAEDVRRIDSEIAKLNRDLGVSASDLTRLDHQIRDLEESSAEIDSLEQKLKGLASKGGPDAASVNDAHAHKALREKERKTIEGLRADLRRVQSETKGLFSGLVRRLEARIDDDIAKGSNRDVFRALSGQIDSLTALLERGVATISEQVDAADSVAGEQENRLAEHHAKQEAAYRELIAKSQEESGRASERNQLQTTYAQAAADKKELQLKMEERGERELTRRVAVARLSDLRDERFALRKGVAEMLTANLKPHVRVSVTQNGNATTFRDILLEALKGNGMKHTAQVDKIVENLHPAALARILQENRPMSLCELTAVDEEKSEKVVNALRDTSLLYALETVELEDLPKVELLDGETYKDAGGLSTGQKCTSILPILLLESEKPLLIDQPEDNLDNAFIYETVVKSIKATKGKRQLIFVTHNPNIPVLGDAERVFVMGSDGKQGRLAKVGTVDELKGDIELLLEGGSEAFLLRKTRYGH